MSASWLWRRRRPAATSTGARVVEVREVSDPQQQQQRRQHDDRRRQDRHGPGAGVGVGSRTRGEAASPDPAPTSSRDYAQHRHATADFTEADDDDDDDSVADDLEGYNREAATAGRGGDEDEDGVGRSSTVLPVFSGSYLDTLPVYALTHAIRVLVSSRTDTTLTWEQLRSPQVTQFLVKPMQQQVRSPQQHFGRATLYALMVNCLQFAKEGRARNAANAGTCATRARVCELLALKLLKEYSVRDLVDALAHDFYPLQGLGAAAAPEGGAGGGGGGGGGGYGPSGQGGYVGQQATQHHHDARGKAASSASASASASARTSTLEVAIRAGAKHFLAHPLVVQQLEAIWNGAVVFSSSADSLHRAAPVGAVAAAPPPTAPSSQAARSRRQSALDVRTPLLGGGGGGAAGSQQQQQQAAKEESARAGQAAWTAQGQAQGQSQSQSQSQGQGYGAYQQQSWQTAAAPGRSVSLYDPRTASPLKLSRLRVPRYRQLLSSCSLAVLVALFLAVLARRSGRITALELAFWFWSAGYMLDELAGVGEKGFGLYVMGARNVVDLAVLALLVVYYAMRASAVFLVDPRRWNDAAYDVLAANAILLLPRVLRVLDHFPYFAQLLIAFRLMAVDLAAVFVLVLVSCSGFLVFFTLSKRPDGGDAADMAYKIFQILMGDTDPAWEIWPTYNVFARALMAVFLIICHFVILAMLIAVLTNSFMAISAKASEEYQFFFAINTISMVKNEPLFSYVAPANIFAWLLLPLRYCVPLRQYVWLNRQVIKATHLPVLLAIFLYERYVLAPAVYEPTDLVEHPPGLFPASLSYSSLPRAAGWHQLLAADPAERAALFAPGVRVREEDALEGCHRKDRALDEVFRRRAPPDARSLRRHERRKTQTAVRSWMDQADDDDDGRGKDVLLKQVHDNWATPPLQQLQQQGPPPPQGGAATSNVGGGGDPARRGPEWQRRHSLGRDALMAGGVPSMSAVHGPSMLSGYGGTYQQRGGYSTTYAYAAAQPTRYQHQPQHHHHQHARQASDVRSAASDPADLSSLKHLSVGADGGEMPFLRIPSHSTTYHGHTDADGDDELVTNDEDDDDDVAAAAQGRRRAAGGFEGEEGGGGGYLPAAAATAGLGGGGFALEPPRMTTTPPPMGRRATSGTGHETPQAPPTATGSAAASVVSPRAGPSRRSLHSRTHSTTTILYNPQDVASSLAEAPPPPPHSSSSESAVPAPFGPAAPQPFSEPLPPSAAASSSSRPRSVGRPLSGGSGGGGRHYLPTLTTGDTTPQQQQGGGSRRGLYLASPIAGTTSGGGARAAHRQSFPASGAGVAQGRTSALLLAEQADVGGGHQQYHQYYSQQGQYYSPQQQQQQQQHHHHHHHHHQQSSRRPHGQSRRRRQSAFELLDMEAPTAAAIRQQQQQQQQQHGRGGEAAAAAAAAAGGGTVSDGESPFAMDLPTPSVGLWREGSSNTLVGGVGGGGAGTGGLATPERRESGGHQPTPSGGGQAQAQAQQQQQQQQQQQAAARVSRAVLARMQNLEDSVADMVREVREVRVLQQVGSVGGGGGGFYYGRGEAVDSGSDSDDDSGGGDYDGQREAEGRPSSPRPAEDEQEHQPAAAWPRRRGSARSMGWGPVPVTAAAAAAAAPTRRVGLVKAKSAAALVEIAGGRERPPLAATRRRARLAGGGGNASAGPASPALPTTPSGSAAAPAARRRRGSAGTPGAGGGGGGGGGGASSGDAATPAQRRDPGGGTAPSAADAMTTTTAAATGKGKGKEVVLPDAQDADEEAVPASLQGRGDGIGAAPPRFMQQRSSF